MNDTNRESIYCPTCFVEVGPSGTCPACRMELRGARTYSVHGANAAEVTAVISELERHHLASRGPWRAGMFYLLCLVVITTIFLAVVRLVPAWALPIVVVAALIGVSVLGALQLRQDGRVSEKGMLSMLRAAFRNARSLGAGQPPGAGPPPA